MSADIIEIRRQIINTPETADFMAGVPIEAAHQRERWPSEHDSGKTPFDWFWLIGYLAQKAATAAVAGDVEKAKHHTISTAAALANWHAALSGKTNAMRPGIDASAIEAASAVETTGSTEGDSRNAQGDAQ
jgi:outer membrane murein-binding lipoprotein Lpp